MSETADYGTTLCSPGRYRLQSMGTINMSGPIIRKYGFPQLGKKFLASIPIEHGVEESERPGGQAEQSGTHRPIRSLRPYRRKIPRARNRSTRDEVRSGGGSGSKPSRPALTWPAGSIEDLVEHVGEPVARLGKASTAARIGVLVFAADLIARAEQARARDTVARRALQALVDPVLDAPSRPVARLGAAGQVDQILDKLTLVAVAVTGGRNPRPGAGW